MTGLLNGGVIQRLKAGHYSVSVVIHDGQNRAVCAAAGCDSRYKRANIIRIFMTQILVVSEASLVAHAGQHRAAGVADAVAVGSCYLLLFMKRFANIVRVFMTIILTVSDLNLLRVLFSGADHSLGANRPLKSHILALNLGLTLTSLSLKLLKRRMCLTSTC